MTTPDGTFPDDSPVFPFLTSIAGSLLTVAPEKGDDLKKQLCDLAVRLVIDQDVERLFRAVVRDGRRNICCSIFGAEALWASAYAYWVVYSKLKTARGTELLFSEHDDTKILPELLDFAFSDRLGRRDTRPWPSHLPGPVGHMDGEVETDVNAATELWLCALAWILHHELAHLRLGHVAKREQELSDEIEADEGATDWLLGGVTDQAVLLKRSLGIATATVWISGLVLQREHRSSMRNRTHPHASERILRALSHSALAEVNQAQEFAFVALKVHLDHWRVSVPPVAYDDGRDALHAYCKALTDWELNR